MNRSAPPKRKFTEILEQGALVDDIFKDQPVPPGSNPFGVIPADSAEAPIEIPQSLQDQPEEPSPIIVAPDEAPPGQNEEVPNLFGENETLTSTNIKFSALTEIFQLITKDCTFDEFIGEILKIAMDHVKSEAGSFIEVDYEKQVLFFRAVVNRTADTENLKQFTIPFGKGVVGFVCEHQQTMALSRVDETSIYLKEISNSVGFDTKNLIAVPVIIRGVTFGCLELLNRVGEDRYTHSDKEVIAAICEYAAKVIENRLLNASLARQLEELSSGVSDKEAA